MERRPVFLGTRKYGAVEDPEEDQTGSEDFNTKRVELSKWINILAAAFSVFVVGVMRNSFHHVQNSVMDDIHQPQDVTSSITILQLGCITFIMPVAGVLTHKFGCRPVGVSGSALMFVGMFTTSYVSDNLMILASHCVVTGVGMALVLMSSLSMSTVYCSQSRRSLSVAVCLVAAVLAEFFPIESALSEMVSWGWRIEFRVLSVVSLIIIAALGLVENFEEKEIQTRSKMAAIFLFIMLLTGDVLVQAAITFGYNYIKQVETGLNIPYYIQVFVFCFGLLTSGGALDMLSCQPLNIIRTVTLLSASIPFLLAYSDSIVMFLVPVSILVVLVAAWLVATFSALVSIVTRSHLSWTMGLVICVRGIVTMVTMYLDTTMMGQMSPVTHMYVSGCLMLTAGIVYTFAAWIIGNKTEMKNNCYDSI